MNRFFLLTTIAIIFVHFHLTLLASDNFDDDDANYPVWTTPASAVHRPCHLVPPLQITQVCQSQPIEGIGFCAPDARSQVSPRYRQEQRMLQRFSQKSSPTPSPQTISASSLPKSPTRFSLQTLSNSAVEVQADTPKKLINQAAVPMLCSENHRPFANMSFVKPSLYAHTLNQPLWIMPSIVEDTDGSPQRNDSNNSGNYSPYGFPQRTTPTQSTAFWLCCCFAKKAD